MARNVPFDIVRAVNAQTSDQAFLVLLEASRSTFGTLRFVNNMTDVTSNGHLYQAFPFSLTLPPDTDEFQPVFAVTIPNTTRELVREFRALAGQRERAQATVTLMASGYPDVPMAKWRGFEVRNIEYDEDLMRFDLSIEDYYTEAYPGDSLSPANVPGIF